MSFRLSDAVRKARLPRNEKAVLRVMADYANEAGECWPSVETIAEEASCHRATVYRALEGLRARRLIVRTGVRNRSVVYRLRLGGSVADCDMSQGAIQTVARRDSDGRRLRHESISESTKEPIKQRKTRADAPPEPLPDWLPAEAWAAFVEHRKEIGRPLKPGAIRETIRELDKLRGDGCPPAKVMEQSIRNGWTGVFMLKDDRHGTNSRSPLPTGIGRTQAGAEAVIEEIRQRTAATGLD